MRVGVLIPYSGEYPQIRRALLDTLKQFQASAGLELSSEFINQGNKADVEKAIEKLYYHEDVDAIIGYVGYPVVTQLFNLIRKYPEKKFIHLSLGETIPLSPEKIAYPANYVLVSANAWRSGAYLGDWVANNLSAQNCLICTSLFDSGYCFTEAFRIGYHSRSQKTLNSTILNNPPGVFDVSGLFSAIVNQRPEHIHVSLCGRELIDFVNHLSDFVDYIPSVSFAFPVFLKGIETPHIKKAYTALSSGVYNEDILKGLIINPIEGVFKALTSFAISVTVNDKCEYQPDEQFILEVNLENQTSREIHHGNLPVSLNAQFNYSAENSISVWQNPYLCI